MKTFVHNGVTLACQRSGNPQGLALVLLHGLTADSGTYCDVIDALGDRADVYALDFRGHGASQRTPGAYTMSDYAEDVMGLMESVVGRPAVLAGHSLGALVAFAVAQSRPDSVLAVLCEEPSLYFHEPATREASRFQRFIPGLRERMAAYQARGSISAEEMAPSYSPDQQSVRVIERRAGSLLAADPQVCDAFLDGSIYNGYDPDRPLPVPLTVLRSDPNVLAAFYPEHEARLLKATPSARVHFLEGAGHEIHNVLATRDVYLSHLLTVLEEGRAVEARRAAHTPR